QEIPKQVKITRVEGVAKPGENLTVSYEVKGLPAGSSLELDYSTDGTFRDEDSMYRERIDDPTPRKLTFQIPSTMPEGRAWVQLRVLDADGNEIDKTKPPTPIKP